MLSKRLVYFILASRCGRTDFPNCKSVAPPVNVDDVEITQKLVNKRSRIDITVQWKLPNAGKNVTGVPVPNGKQALVIVYCKEPIAVGYCVVVKVIISANLIVSGAFCRGSFI